MYQLRNLFRLCLAAVVLTLACTIFNCAKADDTAQATTEKEQPTWRAVRMRNVSPLLVAWWLDPRNNPTPEPVAFHDEITLRVSAMASASSSYSNGFVWPRSQFGGGGFGGAMAWGVSGGLPQIQQKNQAEEDLVVVGVESRSEILIYASAKTHARMQTLFEYFDRPLRRVEIRFQYVDIDAENAAGILGGKKPTEKVPDHARVAIQSTNEFQADLEKLLREKKAKLVQDERIVTLHNFSTSFTLALPENAVVVPLRAPETGDDDDDDNDNTTVRSDLTPKSMTVIDGQWSVVPIVVNITPTMNNDDTITCFITFGQNATHPERTSEQKTVLAKPLQIANTVKDGETFNAGDLMHAGRRWAPAENVPPPKRIRYAFISARIVRTKPAGADGSAAAPTANTKE